MSDEQMKPRFVDAVSNDPFDLAKLRLPQDFLAESPVKKLLTTVPVRRPGPQDFVRVHPSAAYRHLMAMLKIEDDRDEIYAVDLNAVPDLRNECYAANLFTAITRTGVVFLWPVRVPAADGRANEWHVSAATAAQCRHARLDTHEVKHVAAGLRNLPSREQHSGPAMARAIVRRVAAHRLSRPSNQQHRPSRSETVAWGMIRVGPASLQAHRGRRYRV